MHRKCKFYLFWGGDRGNALPRPIALKGVVPLCNTSETGKIDAESVPDDASTLPSAGLSELSAFGHLSVPRGG